MIPPRNLLTEDGYDLQWGTNVIGHFFFTHLLLPALIAGKETSPDGHTRIVTTSSMAAYMSVIHWDSFRDGPARKKLSLDTLYAQSKLRNSLSSIMNRQISYLQDSLLSDTQIRAFSRLLAILSTSGITGNLKTELNRHLPSIARAIMNLVLYPASNGALTQLWAGTMPETIEYNGQFLIPWARVGRCREEGYDPALGEKLWDYLMEEIKDK
ncbi:hypothetical protein NLI96_g10356 [Meripilus lineatus]|uniref:NAD(P)-binding protein n=1 Tax=Meripilus lineatus TaxID=2056292 RepID=A0AAD5UVA8_9APHY|nr:hypothetical protein NLI96_g10356 [Physisporinus lineatus]